MFSGTRQIKVQEKTNGTLKISKIISKSNAVSGNAILPIAGMGVFFWLHFVYFIFSCKARVDDNYLPRIHYFYHPLLLL
jgi:hypothetical protein